MMICRSIDNLRRLCIPVKFIRKLEFSQEQEVEITIEYGEICIKKFIEEDLTKREYTGIVRLLDNLNRVTIPAEYLKVLKIDPLQKVMITLQEEIIKVKKD